MIVVTGATGRTGRAATEALLAKGEKVRLVGRDAKKMTPFVKLGAVDKSEGVVKRHFSSAMLCGTARISEWWRTEALKLSR
jgi:uncharacterized protein YbjT (DUF2867 family)